MKPVDAYRQELLKLPPKERAERLYQDMQKILNSGPRVIVCTCDKLNTSVHECAKDSKP